MDKLSYKLDVFEGPLDLLLTLIAKNKLNIYDINISQLLEQYMEQIKLMQDNDMDVASEFLEMAARLVYIKTVMLLPQHDEVDSLKEELSAELLEYSVCKQMAKELSTMTDGFGRFVRSQMKIECDKTYKRKHEAVELIDAYLSAVGRGLRHLPPPVDNFKPLVAKKIVAVSTKVISILRNLRKKTKVKWKSLFAESKSRSELVATFLAILELVKARRVTVDGEGEKMTVTMFGKEDNND